MTPDAQAKKQRPRAARLWLRILAAILAPTMLLGLIEVVFRTAGSEPKRSDAPLIFVGADFTGPFPIQWDDDLFWRIAPGREFPWPGGERVNPQGFRGPSFSVKKPVGAHRVLCLGDSCTFGSSVTEDASFAHRLRRWLGTAPTGQWDVVNAGVPGYSIWQMARFLALEGDTLAPDVIIVYAGAWNDYTPGIGGPDAMLAERVRKAKEGLGRLRFVQVLRSWAQQPRDPDADKTTKDLYSKSFWGEKKKLDGARVSPPDFGRLIDEIHDDARKRGATLVLIVPPAPAKTRKEWPEAEEYADCVRTRGAARGIPVVDLRELFAGLGRDDKELFADRIHPGTDGHRIAFDALAARLSGLGVAAPLPAAPAKSDPIDLLKLAGNFSYFEGDQLTPGNVANITPDGPGVRAPCPCQMRFERIVVPPAASLFVDFAHGNPKTGRPEGTTFRVLCGAEGSELRPILEKNYDAAHPPRQRETCRADLAPFAGQTVTLAMEVRGTADVGLWSNAHIDPYR